MFVLARRIRENVKFNGYTDDKGSVAKMLYLNFINYRATEEEAKQSFKMLDRVIEKYCDSDTETITKGCIYFNHSEIKSDRKFMQKT